MTHVMTSTFSTMDKNLTRMWLIDLQNVECTTRKSSTVEIFLGSTYVYMYNILIS